MHSVLGRQLARLNLDELTAPEPSAWTDFLATVSAAYDGHDQDRYLLERSLTLSSKEMGDLHSTLRRDRERLAAVIDSLDRGLIVLNRALRVEIVNPEAVRIIGVSLEELRTWTLQDLKACADGDPSLCAVFEAMLAPTGDESSGRIVCEDGRLRSADGRTVPVSASIIPVQHDSLRHGVVVVLSDISERQQLELELRQAQKLEAVGLLAAGVAHEINTPMQFVGDNLVFIETSTANLMRVLKAVPAFLGGDRVAPDRFHRLAHLVDECEPDYLSVELPLAVAQSREGIERVTSIVGAMKSFSHPGEAAASLADLNQALRDTVTVAWGELRDIAEVTLDLGDLPPVLCMIHDLRPVFLNLVVNASHAIADRAREQPGQGLISVTSARVGDSVVITIGDNGSGMPDHVVDHIFEPFFTTKEVGRGTGQGLALAHRIIVNGHQGKLSFTTRPGEGTTFQIHLPVGER
jgi:PAS domain S-box-containing protein